MLLSMIIPLARLVVILENPDYLGRLAMVQIMFRVAQVKRYISESEISITYELRLGCPLP